MSTLTKQPTSWISSAPVSFSVAQDLTSSPDQVWAALTDYESWTAWFPGMKACHLVDKDVDGLGSTRFVHMDAFKVNEEIIEWEPGRVWAMTVLDANLPVLSAMAERVTITPDDGGGCRVEWTVGVALKSWTAPLKPILVGNTKKSLTKALAGLDDHIAGR